MLKYEELFILYLIQNCLGMVKNIINSITSKTSVFHIKKALFENEVISLNHNLK